MIEELVCKVFCDRNLSHLQHWNTPSYSQHMALNSFYDDVISDIDEFVEVYQGLFGKITVKSIPETKKSPNITTTLTDSAIWISDNRDKLCKGVSTLENLLDSITGTYFRTIYKLKNLQQEDIMAWPKKTPSVAPVKIKPIPKPMGLGKVIKPMKRGLE